MQCYIRPQAGFPLQAGVFGQDRPVFPELCSAGLVLELSQFLNQSFDKKQLAAAKTRIATKCMLNNR